MEQWKEIPEFPNYEVSTYGQIRNVRFGRPLAINMNQYGCAFVGLWRDDYQYKRSVPLLVARAFIPQPYKLYNTPINLDGDRWNNHVENLVWRPREFAVRYNRQFRVPYQNHIPYPIIDLNTNEISENSFECARRYGLLERDVVMSLENRTYAWPTYQMFGVFAN